MNKFFEDLFVAKDKIISIKKETTKQATCNKWESLCENRITSNDVHKVLIPKKDDKVGICYCYRLVT